jgi:lipooligosaccharide transport system permease protein
VRWLTAALDWQSRAVVRRHLLVYLRNWHTAFLPPAVEPVMMLLAFGLGLGGWVPAIEWQGRPLPYLDFIAPGLLAYATFTSAVFQALYAAFIRMRYQRTWEGQLTTQVELRHVVWGEVLWAALLSVTYVAIVGAVLALLRLTGLVSFNAWLLPALLPVVFLAGCAFAALGLAFTATMPTIDHMNLPVFLLVLPLAFVSGTYFPVTSPTLLALSAVNPLYRLAETFRAVLLGGPVAGHLLALAALALLMILVLVPLDMRLLRRRMLAE